ncbi:MAG TPA: trypsin-like peptidase domain-containing protein [Lapillicoccus sp.]|nr:trypsin-like peptidase domain-containing protein [Lapillicoccus sp.]
MARVIAPPEADAAGSSGDGDPGRPRQSRAGTRVRAAGERVARPLVAGWRRARAVPARVWVVAVVALALIGTVGWYALTRPNPTPPVTQQDIDATVKKGIEDQAKAEAAAPPDGTVAYQAIQPSLVLINTKRPAGSGAESSSGAGVIVKADGTILTALHVVNGAEAITVSYTDGTSSPATIADQQPENDIATLTPSVLPQTLVPAVLGGGVAVGTPVFAVGHPLGLTDSLSGGVVSALDRSVNIGDGKKLEHLIQFDAAVNPGNSGGPLLNKAGQVVGIVTGLANPSQQGFFVGIGFAVPIATAGGGAGAPAQ